MAGITDENDEEEGMGVEPAQFSSHAIASISLLLSVAAFALAVAALVIATR